SGGGGRRDREPALRTPGEGDEGEHDRDLDQYPDDRRQGRTRGQAEQADRDGDREFEEVGGADHRSGGGDVERQLEDAGERVREREDAVALDQERDRDQQHPRRLREDRVGLEAEE